MDENYRTTWSSLFRQQESLCNGHWLCPNVSTTPIMAMGYWQCLTLSVVHLKGKHCRKPHCRNGVVNTFRHDVCNSDFNWPKLKKDLITVQHVWYKTSYQRKLGPGMAFLSQSEPDLVQEVNFWLTKKIDRLNMTIFVLHLCHCWRWNMCKFSKKKQINDSQVETLKSILH